MLFHESAASMEQRMPENLARMKGPDPMESDPTTKESCAPTTVVISTPSTTTSTTKLKLSFSVDRLLASEPAKRISNLERRNILRSLQVRYRRQRTHPPM
nr:homeobox protein H2.0 [Drosophila suzukii]